VISILVDMNLSPDWIGRLDASGIQARHWTEVGPAGAADSEIMAWAKENGFAVLTHDLDFSAILAATQAIAPSVILLRMQDVFPDSTAQRVIDAIRTLNDALVRGAIVTIGAADSRVRILPLPGA
jgi:predicted nuclease of predicted toxin-antitoxin system